jgi:hypothetical protein
LNRLQDHLLGKLLSEPLLKFVSVAEMRKMVKLDVAARVAPHLAGRNGKVGAGIIIGLPVADPAKADNDIPGAQFESRIPLDILVKDDISLVVSNGAGITAEQIAITVWLLLSQFLNQATGSGNWTIEGWDPIEDKKGAYGYRIVIVARGAEDQPAKVAAPTANFAGGNCTLTTATGGAIIYYTTDGTFPGPWTAPAGYTANSSQAYSAPFSAPTGTQICACAFIANSTTTIGSDVWFFTAP